MQTFQLLKNMGLVLFLGLTIMACNSSDDNEGGGSEGYEYMKNVPKGEIVPADQRFQALTGYDESVAAKSTSATMLSTNSQKWWTLKDSGYEYWCEGEHEKGDGRKDIGPFGFYPNGKVYTKSVFDDSPIEYGKWKWTDSSKSKITIIDSSDDVQTFEITELNNIGFVIAEIISEWGCTRVDWYQFEVEKEKEKEPSTLKIRYRNYNDSSHDFWYVYKDGKLLSGRGRLFEYEKEHQTFGEVIKTGKGSPITTTYMYDAGKGLVRKNFEYKFLYSDIKKTSYNEYKYIGNEVEVTYYNDENKKTKVVTFTGIGNPSRIEAIYFYPNSGEKQSKEIQHIKYNMDPSKKSPFSNLRGWELARVWDELDWYEDTIIDLDEHIAYGVYDSGTALVDEIEITQFTYSLIDGIEVETEYAWSSKITSEYQFNSEGYPIKEIRKKVSTNSTITQEHIMEISYEYKK